MRKTLQLTAMLLATGWGFLSCGGDAITAPSTGSLEITTNTTGPEPDAVGYTVTVDGGSAIVLGTNASHLVENLQAGDHVISLSGISSNCKVAGENPRRTTVPAGASVEVGFGISCSLAHEAMIAFSLWSPISPSAIYKVNPDGTDLKKLTRGLISEIRPKWSPDGNRIAFFRDFDLYVLDADGGNPTKITPRQTSMNGAFAWSRDGSKLAFEIDSMVECVEEGIPSFCHQNQIWTAQSDGSQARKVTIGNTPSWSPDGLKIAFESGGQIQVVNIDGSNSLFLTGRPYRAHTPKWSPDGSRIAFGTTLIAKNQYIGEIFVMNADGSRAVSLTAGQGNDDTEPVWSPDGSKIAFSTKNPDGSDYELAVMNSDGSARRVLTHNPALDGGPTWSPDGGRMAFSRKSYQEGAAALDIYLVNVDGTGEIRLLHSSSSQMEDPSWSSD